MPALAPSANPGRFGAWSGGPLTGTVTTPPPSAGPASPPSATAGGYLPQADEALPTGGGGGGFDGGDLGNSGPNPEWGKPSTPTGGAPYGTALPDKAIPMPAGGGPGTGGNGSNYGMGGGGAGLDGGGGSGPLTGGVMALDDGGEVPGEPEDDGDADDQQAQNTAAPTGDVNQAMGEPGGQQAQQAVDPMSIIQGALAFGRQSMGMPKSFTDGMPMSNNIEDRRTTLNDDPSQPGRSVSSRVGKTTPSGWDTLNNMTSFDDGGEVPMPGAGGEQQPQQGGGLPDPRKTMAYLAGAGGVQPEIADALEQHIDPQGQMDPAERMLKAVAAAPTPESQFGLLQHYRTRANAYTGAARAALDKGNLAQAAQHATSAFDNIPTGYKVQFAPARGGLAVMAKKIGGQPQQQQGFLAGGPVGGGGGGDSAPLQMPFDPEVEQNLGTWGLKNDQAARKDAYKKHTPSYDDGGAVPEIWSGKTIPKMKKIGGQPQQQQGFSEGGSVDTDNPAVMMKAYDDGGEVTEDDGDEDDQTGSFGGVVPLPGTPSFNTGDDTPAPEPAAQPQATGTQPVSELGEPMEQPAQPTIVQPSKLHDLLKSGWDSLVEKAMAPVPQGQSGGLPGFLSQLAQAGGQAANMAAGALNKGVDAVTGAATTGLNWLTGAPNSDPAVDAAIKAGEAGGVGEGAQPKPADGTPPAGGPQPAAPTPPQPQAPAQRQQPRGAAPGDKFVNDSRPGRQPSVDATGQPTDPEDRAMARLQKQANAIFGNVINPQVIAQKQQYIAKGMEAFQASNAKMDQTNAMWGNRSNIAAQTEAGRNTRATNSEAGKDTRSMRSLAERLAATQLTVNGRAANQAQTNFVRMIGQQLGANPTLAANPDAVLKAIAPYAPQMKQLGMTPRDVMQNIQQAQQAPEPEQQGGQQQPGGQQAEPMKQYNGQWYTKAQYEAMRAAKVTQ